MKIININLTSFNEIGEETEFDEVLFRRRILEIIDQRGKLHNPITGTGGMLYGRVLKMDPQYENHYGLQVGDEIISLTSLSVTPMRLDRIPVGGFSKRPPDSGGAVHSVFRLPPD